tara:strand:+ start:191 stop:301 length:111 start_codon:yes stop_codon:yes gene_type:complete
MLQVDQEKQFEEIRNSYLGVKKKKKKVDAYSGAFSA